MMHPTITVSPVVKEVEKVSSSKSLIIRQLMPILIKNLSRYNVLGPAACQAVNGAAVVIGRRHLMSLESAVFFFRLSKSIDTRAKVKEMN